MKELKRILSLLVVFAMMLSISVFATDETGEGEGSNDLPAVTAAETLAETAVATAEAAMQTVEAIAPDTTDEVEVSQEAVQAAAENFDVAALAAIVEAAAESAKADAKAADKAANDVQKTSDELQKQVDEGTFEYVTDVTEYEAIDEESGETYTTTGAELAEDAQAAADAAKEAAAKADAASKNAANAADAAQYALEASDTPATEEEQQVVDTAKEAAVEAAGKADAAKDAAAEVEAVIEAATATAEEAAVIVAKAADAAKSAAEAANNAAIAAKDAADTIAKNLATIENADQSHTEDEVSAAKAEVVEKVEKAVELAKVADEKAAIAKEAAARAKDVTLSGEEKANAIKEAADAAREATTAANEAAVAANDAADAAWKLAEAKGWPFWQQVVTAKGVIVTAHAQAGVFPKDTVLTAEDVEPEQVEEQMDVAASDVVTAVDINFVLNGANIQPDTSKGLVDVTITDPNAEVEGKTLAVKTVKDGETETIKPEVDSKGEVAFTTDHFTEYVVVKESPKEVTVETAEAFEEALTDLSVAKITVINSIDLTTLASNEIEANGEKVLVLNDDVIVKYKNWQILAKGTKLTVLGNGKFTGAKGAIDVYGEVVIGDESSQPTFETSLNSSGSALYVNEGAKLTINNVNINAAYYAIYNEATLVINGGSIKSTSSSSSGNWAYCVKNEGTATINGGTIQGVQGALTTTNGGKSTIYGGAFITKNTPGKNDAYYAIYAADNGKVTIYDGYFHAANKTRTVCASDEDIGTPLGQVTIYGGHFNGPMQEQTESGGREYVAITPPTGYEIVEESVTVDGLTYPYAVKPTDAVAQIGTMKFATLADAIKAAQNGDTVKLMKDFNVSMSAGEHKFQINKNLTIDGQENTITVTSSGSAYLFEPLGGTAVTFKDLTVDANNQRVTVFNYYKTTGGTLNNVEVKNVSTNTWNPALTVNSSTITLTGGTKLPKDAYYSIDASIGGNITNGANVINVDDAKIDTIFVSKGGGEGTAHITVSGQAKVKTITIYSGLTENATVELKGGRVDTINVGSDKGFVTAPAGSTVSVGSIVVAEETHGSIQLSGGTFNNNPTTYLAEGAQVHENSDGTWTVGSTDGHTWSVSYAWSADNSSVTATSTCAGNAAHNVTETVSTTVSTTPASYTAAGSTVYTATFTNGAFATQTRTVTIPQLVPDGSDYDDGSSSITMQPTQPETIDIDEEATPLAALPADLSEVTVTVTNEAGEEVEVVVSELPNVYADVQEESWSRDAIAYANALGLMNGVGDNADGEATFNPQGTTTSEMLTTVLYRAVSGEETSGENWADDALAWAADANLTEGIGLEEGKEVTREQMVTMMYRVAAAKGFDVSATADLTGFKDADDLSDFARAAMEWAVSVGLINGMDGGLNASGSVTREQIATILMRFNELTKDAV